LNKLDIAKYSTVRLPFQFTIYCIWHVCYDIFVWI